MIGPDLDARPGLPTDLERRVRDAVRARPCTAPRARYRHRSRRASRYPRRSPWRRCRACEPERAGVPRAPRYRPRSPRALVDVHPMPSFAGHARISPLPSRRGRRCSGDRDLKGALRRPASHSAREAGGASAEIGRSIGAGVRVRRRNGDAAERDDRAALRPEARGRPGVAEHHERSRRSSPCPRARRRCRLRPRGRGASASRLPRLRSPAR